MRRCKLQHAAIASHIWKLPNLFSSKIWLILRKLYLRFFFQIEWDKIVVIVFLSILSQMELLPRSYPILFERKWKYSFISALGDGLCCVTNRRYFDSSEGPLYATVACNLMRKFVQYMWLFFISVYYASHTSLLNKLLLNK